ncbi:MAG: IS66 family transposase [Rhodospirillales bacterium]
MTTVPEPLPSDLGAAHAMILAERVARRAAEAEAAAAKETKRILDLEIERLKLEIARLKRHRFGTSSERSTRLEQLELALSELEETVAAADAAQALRAAERRAPEQARRTTARKPARRPAAGTPAAHPRRLPGAHELSLLRWGGAQAGRGDHREP